MHRILSIILLVIAVGGLVFSKWVAPWLQTAINWLASSPFGAVFVAMSILVLVANVINWLIGIGYVRY